MRSNLLPILQETDEYEVPNDLDEGAFVIGDEGDYVLHVQKPKTVLIPRVEIAVSANVPPETRERRRQRAIDDKIEALVDSAIIHRFPNASYPKVSENYVLEGLQAQLKPPGRVVWLIASRPKALEAAYRIAAAFRATMSGPLEVLRGSDDEMRFRADGPLGYDTIIGMTHPVGFYLRPEPPVIVKGNPNDPGHEVAYGYGWLLYPGKVAAVELV